MAKRRKHRRVKGQRRPAQRPGRAPAPASIPSAQTFFRFPLADPQTRDLLRQATSRLKPVIWTRDRAAVEQIKRAGTAEEVLDLVTVASGLGETAWQDRMRQFGPEVVPLISKRLKTVRNIQDEATQDMALEKLIAELRWRGDAGAGVLMDRFNDLNDYGRSLACVVLGLLGAQGGADRMWTFYQRIVRKRRSTYFVGALWGLIDLKDDRASGALAELLIQGRNFYELFGFLSLAGDARAVVPLLMAATQLPETEQTHATMALVSVAHRIGRDALLAEFEKVAKPQEPKEARKGIADDLLAQPTSKAEEYFALFYRGLKPGDVARMFSGRGGR